MKPTSSVLLYHAKAMRQWSTYHCGHHHPFSRHGARLIPRRKFSHSDSNNVRATKSEPGSARSEKMPVTWVGLAIMAVTGTGLAYFYQVEKERMQQQALGKVTSYGKPALGGPWTLVDFTGRPVTDADFRGEFLLLYFGFTHCPDICPSELVKVGKILDSLDREPNLPVVRPVFISVDPDRDNVGQLRHYAQGALPEDSKLSAILI
ncbi:sco1 family protein [Nannochloropsis gaditana]|uniref:Sco1 family protein n=1 Tax=Nannochloropsis gaditana TaxID=72520 RepID=W7U1H0_9STRA|nr:sco1 family protein [Nannochloropsis gaditana]